MSIPKITPRAQRVIRIESDPYLFENHRDVPRIYRKVYEDGSCTLFVGDTPVSAVRYDTDRFLGGHVALGLGGPILHLRGVPPQERAWLLESMEDRI